MNNNKKYDVVTTDDGMWEIYKDIDTKTTKVNVYVTSKYYYPSFEQYVFEQFNMSGFLLGCALPIYDFSDLEDYFWNYIEYMYCESKGEIEALWNKTYPNSNFSELIEQLGIKDYELYTEVGSDIVNAIKNNSFEEIDFSDNELEFKWSMYMGLMNPNPNEYGLDLNELLKNYNELYGEKIKLQISESEKNKTYQIIFPNGQEKTITGSELTHAKFRYAALENGDIQIKISDGTDEKKIDYKGVTNIENCLYEEGDFVYTYNCLPILFEETFSEGSLARCMLYRFDFGGWNVTNRYLVDKHYVGEERCSLNYEDFPNLAYCDQIEDYNVSGKVLEQVSGEPVTSMFGTYLAAQFVDRDVEIPKSIKYMFYTFRFSKFQEGTKIFIPESVQYTCYAFKNKEDEYIASDWKYDINSKIFDYEHSFYCGKEFDGSWIYVKTKE